MSYFRISALQRSRIAYGCIVALGSVSVAGIAEIELQGKVFSKWIQKIEQNIKDRASSASPTESQIVTVDHVFHPFIVVGQEISKVALQVWPYIQGALGALSLLKDHWSRAFESIKNFIKSLFDSEIFNKIFENLHMKIWNLLAFLIAGGEGRNTFFSLFGGEKKDSTFLAAQLLLGMTVAGVKNFKVKNNVFHYLILRWMDKPTEVTNKFDRLSTAIKKLTDRLKGGDGGDSSSGNGDGGGDEESDEKTYWLEIPTVKEYLNVKEGLSETLFNAFWTGEVLLKIKTGTSDHVGVKSWVSMFGEFLG